MNAPSWPRFHREPLETADAEDYLYAESDYQPGTTTVESAWSRFERRADELSSTAMELFIARPISRETFDEQIYSPVSEADRIDNELGSALSLYYEIVDYGTAIKRSIDEPRTAAERTVRDLAEQYQRDEGIDLSESMLVATDETTVLDLPVVTSFMKYCHDAIELDDRTKALAEYAEHVRSSAVEALASDGVKAELGPAAERMVDFILTPPVILLGPLAAARHHYMPEYSSVAGSFGVNDRVIKIGLDSMYDYRTESLEPLDEEVLIHKKLSRVLVHELIHAASNISYYLSRIEPDDLDSELLVKEEVQSHVYFPKFLYEGLTEKLTVVVLAEMGGGLTDSGGDYLFSSEPATRANGQYREYRRIIDRLFAAADWPQPEMLGKDTTVARNSVQHALVDVFVSDSHNMRSRRTEFMRLLHGALYPGIIQDIDGLDAILGSAKTAMVVDYATSASERLPELRVASGQYVRSKLEARQRLADMIRSSERSLRLIEQQIAQSDMVERMQTRIEDLSQKLDAVDQDLDRAQQQANELYDCAQQFLIDRTLTASRDLARMIFGREAVSKD